MRTAGNGHGKRKVLVGRHAAMYDVASGWALGWLHSAVARRVESALPLSGRVLDVGTGPGRLLTALAARRPDAGLVGIDPSPDMVERARRHMGPGARAQVERAAAEELPFDDATFDVVVSTLSAHHWSDVRGAIAEQARVLRPGGTLLVVDLRRSMRTVDVVLRTMFATAEPTTPRIGWPACALVVCQRVTL